MGQNTTIRALRAAVLESRLIDFAGYRLTLDCGAAGCEAARVFAVADLARLHGGERSIGATLARLRCRRCGGAPRAAWIETGPELARRGRMRRLALLGREGAGDGR